MPQPFHFVRIYDSRLWKRIGLQAVAEGVERSEIMRRAAWLYLSDPSAAIGMLKDHPESNVTPTTDQFHNTKLRMAKQVDAADIASAAPSRGRPRSNRGPETPLDPHGLGF